MEERLVRNGAHCVICFTLKYSISPFSVKPADQEFHPVFPSFVRKDCDEAAAHYLNFHTIRTHLVDSIILMIIRLLLLFLSLTQQSIGTPPILSTSPWLHCKRVRNDDGRAEHN